MEFSYNLLVQQVALSTLHQTIVKQRFSGFWLSCVPFGLCKHMDPLTA